MPGARYDTAVLHLVHPSAIDRFALAAIQGLNQIVQEKDAEIRALKAKVAKVEQLESTVAELSTMVLDLSRQVKGGTL